MSFVSRNYASEPNHRIKMGEKYTDIIVEVKEGIGMIKARDHISDIMNMGTNFAM